MCFVRKGLDWVFTRHELTWLDDIMPETHKKEKEEKKKKLMASEDTEPPEKKLSVRTTFLWCYCSTAHRSREAAYNLPRRISEVKHTATALVLKRKLLIMCLFLPHLHQNQVTYPSGAGVIRLFTRFLFRTQC